MTERPLYLQLASSSLFADMDENLLAKLEPGLSVRELDSGEVLMRQGEPGESMFVLVRGELEVRVDTASGTPKILDRLRAGATVGEMSLVVAQNRSATVVASRPSELVELSRHDFERLASEHPQLHEAVLRETAPRLQRVQLTGLLESWFGHLTTAEIHALQADVEWVHLAGGETLYAAGEDADGMYIVVSGRVQLARRAPDGSEQTVRDVGRGESLAEEAALGDAPRTDHAFALRDSHLVKLHRNLVHSHPSVLAQIARSLLARSQTWERSRKPTRTFAIVPLAGSAPAVQVGELLTAQLRGWGRVLQLDAAAVDRVFGRSGAAQVQRGDAFDPALTHWLNEREAEHDYLVFTCEPSSTAWTRRSLRQADVVLLVADAAADAAQSPLEEEATALGVEVQLVLVHPDETALPQGTSRWLDARSPTAFHHLRLGSEPDAGRLARRLTGRAVGLVFSGGGARGYVHIGLIRAFEEVGIPIDLMAGTSMGALVGGSFALTQSYEFCYRAASSFGDPKNLLDRTLPLVALNRSRAVTQLYQHLFEDTRIEDLWTPFFCVSANLTRAEAVVHESGPVWEAVRASSAIPGIFTPLVYRGDVLVDGGVMNNFPVDLMRERIDTGVVIGSNAYTQNAESHAYEFGPSISGWRVLLERLLPFGPKRNYPSMLGTLMRATSLSSKHLSEAALTLADLTIRYPTETYGSLEFDRYDELIELGYTAGREELSHWLAQRSSGSEGAAIIFAPASSPSAERGQAPSVPGRKVRS